MGGWNWVWGGSTWYSAIPQERLNRVELGQWGAAVIGSFFPTSIMLFRPYYYCPVEMGNLERRAAYLGEYEHHASPAVGSTQFVP